MTKLLCIIVVLLIFSLNAGGCSSIESQRENATIEMGFQPEMKGVKDVNETGRALIYEIEKNNDISSDSVRKLIYQMSWKQACMLYQTSTNTGVRQSLLLHIMYHIGAKSPFDYGVWTREEIIQLLGEPDGVEKYDRTPIYRREDVIQFLKELGAIKKIRTIIYTAADYVSDSAVPAYFFNFDDNGQLVQITVGG